VRPLPAWLLPASPVKPPTRVEPVGHLLAEYLRATARHSYSLLVGAVGAVLTIVGLVAPRILQVVGITLFASGLVGAQFQAWREMRVEREQAKAELVDAGRREAELQAKLDLRNTRKALRESLGDFFAQGEEVRAWIIRGGEPVSYVASGEGWAGVFTKPKDEDDDSLQGSLDRAIEWEEQVAFFLAEHLGNSYAALFRSYVGTIDPAPPELGDDEHSERWTLVDRRLQVLGRIIREVGEDLVGA
jgi:hypothetical protein